MRKLRLIEGGLSKRRKPRQVRRESDPMTMRQSFEAMAANPKLTSRLLQQDLARLQRDLFKR